MKMIVVAFALVAVALAAPPADQAQIVRSDFVQSPEGGYNFGFETDQGMVRSETGEVKEALDEEKKPHPVIVVRGSYSYIDNDGNPQSINYIADENGFQAVGDSIPKVPVARR